MPKLKKARADLEALEDEYMVALADMCRTARVAAGLSQYELAKKLETSQPNIAISESGSWMISMRKLIRWADATGYRLVIQLERVK